MIVPALKIEAKIQTEDQTRFDASRSFITKGAGLTVTEVKITPGSDGTEIDVFSEDVADWFLDWAWQDFKMDITEDNCELPFKLKSDANDYVALVDEGTYTLSELADAVSVALNAAVPGVDWEVTLDEAKQLLTIDVSEEVEIQGNKPSLWPVLGFTSKKSDIEFKGDVIEYLSRAVFLEIVASDNAEPTPTLTSETRVVYQKVYNPFGDALFSTDDDLLVHENDILKWVSSGRNSFIDAHRRSQEKIMQWLDQNGFTDINGKRLTKRAFTDHEDVRLWSAYMTLNLLFMSFQNATDDVFKEKASYYKELMIASRNQAQLNLDTDGDGETETEAPVTTWSGSIQMR